MTTCPLKWGYYTDLTPERLAHIRDTYPVAYLPWGALEWHGPHLPLGVDGIIAQSLSERLVERTGGVLLPTTWWGITAVPHVSSISLSDTVVRALWDGLFLNLSRAGWNVVVVISGHYAPGHELVLMEAAEHAISQYNLLVLALPPLAMVDATMLDHAALWETSVMMALSPELVNLASLGDGPINPAHNSVIGKDPRGTATPSMGKRALRMAEESIVKAVEQLLREENAAPLHVIYERRRTLLASYIERYGSDSLDDAYQAWWNDMCQEPTENQQTDDTWTGEERS
jgi:creatinine amidohydrolase